jgi:hypothetical protein
MNDKKCSDCLWYLCGEDEISICIICQEDVKEDDISCEHYVEFKEKVV